MIHKCPFGLSMIIVCALVEPAALVKADERPCRADIEKFCADVARGGARVAKCLQKHRAELSPACKARGREVRERIREAHEECKEDVSKFCGDVRSGEGHVVACLRRHDKDLSVDCRTALKPAR